MAFSAQRAEELAADYTAAWNSGSPGAVASHYAENGSIIINGGDPWKGRSGVAEMAAGFFADIPDLSLVCDAVRFAGGHVAYLWTFTGTHAGSERPVRVSGWEEWDIDENGQIRASQGWFDGEDYERQTNIA